MIGAGHSADKQLFRLDRRRRLAFSVSEPQHVGSICQNSPFFRVHAYGVPNLRRNQGAFGLAENAFVTFNDLVLYVTGMAHFNGVNRVGLRHQGVQAADAKKLSINP